MNYYNRPKHNNHYRVIEITPAKVIMVVIGILVGFVIPVQLIDIYQQQADTIPYTAEANARVAGASDVDYTALFTQTANNLLGDRSALLTLGLAMLVIAAGLAIYLIYRLNQPANRSVDRTYQLDLTD